MSDKKAYKRLGFTLFGFAAAIVILWLFSGHLLRLFAPSLLALILAWIIDPLVRSLNKKTKWGHKVCSIVVTAAFFIIIGSIATILIYSIVIEIYDLADNIGGITDAIKKFFDNILTLIENKAEYLPASMSGQLRNALNNLVDGIGTTYNGFVSNLTKSLSDYALKLPSWLFFAGIFIVGTFFFSFRIPFYRTRLAEKTNADPEHPINLIKRVTRSGFGGYMRATGIMGAWVGALCMVSFMIMGQPYAVLLGVLMGICDIIPNFGAGTVMLPWAAILLFMGNTKKAILMAVAVAIVGLTRNMIYPHVVGSQTGLSPLLTVISSFIGWRLWGVLGMIIGPILAVIIVNIFQSGIFDGFVSDLKVVFSDISRKLSGADEEALP